MGVWSVDILCGDDALQVYRRMLEVGLRHVAKLPTYKKCSNVIRTDDGHKLLKVDHTPDECRELLDVVKGLEKDLNVRQHLESNFFDILHVVNERGLNLTDRSDKLNPRPAGNTMSILAFLMMGVGCRFPHGLKTSILAGIQHDQFSRHYAPRQQLMSEFATVVSEYDPLGGQCVEWPVADMREALHVIKMNAATTPREHWEDDTLLHTPFVPFSRINRRMAKAGLPLPYTTLETGAEMICSVRRPGYYVVTETLLRDSVVAKAHAKKCVGDEREASKESDQEKVHVLIESAWAQEILEAERVVTIDKSPFSPAHLKIGAPVLVQGLKSAMRYNGTKGTVVGYENGRLVVDLSDKILLVKRENLVMWFSTRHNNEQEASTADQAGDSKKPSKRSPTQAAAAAATSPATKQHAEGRSSSASAGGIRSASARDSAQNVPSPNKAANAANGQVKKDPFAETGRGARDGAQAAASSKVVQLTPALQTVAAKEAMRKEVGVCLRSGTVIFVGDDYAMLSCSVRCGPTLLKLSALFELCPAASRRMDKVLGIVCPRPGCTGKVQGLKGLKDSVAVREGNLGKGSKGPSGSECEGGGKREVAGKGGAAPGMTKERWSTSVQSTTCARGSAGGAEWTGEAENEMDGEAECGLGKGEEQDAEQATAAGVAGKVLLGKDGTEFRLNPHKAPTRKDHGFLKKVKDKKKDKEMGPKTQDTVNSAVASEEPEAAEHKTREENCDNSSPKTAATTKSTKGIIVIKPPKKCDETSNLSPPEQQDEIDKKESDLPDSLLIPLVRDEDSDDGFALANGVGYQDAEGNARHGSKEERKQAAKKKGKLVLSLQDFHSTSSVDLTPGLSFEEQEYLARIEQERKDEILAREIQRQEAYEYPDRAEHSKPCFYMRDKGSCPFGTSCTHSHDPDVLFPKDRGRGYKIRMCYNWLETGSCWMGDSCSFAHGEHELRSRGEDEAIELCRVDPATDAPFASSYVAGARPDTFAMDWQAPLGTAGSVQQLPLEEQERIRREGQQQYQLHLMHQAQKHYDAQQLLERQRAEAEEQYYQQRLAYQARHLYAEQLFFERQQAEKLEREAAERKAAEAAAEEAKRNEERRLLAEKQEAERVFMRKFLGAGFSSLAPEFSPA